MRYNAFDDVEMPCDYKRQLFEARELLNARVGNYAWERLKDKDASYRELAAQFNMSPALLYRIVWRYKRGMGWTQALAWVGRQPKMFLRKRLRVRKPSDNIPQTAAPDNQADTVSTGSSPVRHFSRGGHLHKINNQ